MDGEKKPVVRDGRKLVPTIVTGVVLAILFVLIIPVFTISWKDLNNSGGGGVILAFVLALGMILIIPLLTFGIIISIVLLVVSIGNRKSELKQIRIISYVLDGLIVAFIIASIIKIILLLVGV